VSKLKIESSLWKPTVDYSNFHDIFLSFQNVGHDFFFLLRQFLTFLEASEMTISTPIDLEAPTFGHVGI